jgi:hypothetical protein
VTRGSRREIPNGRAMGSSSRWTLALVATMALLVAALAGPVGPSSGLVLPGTTQVAATAPLGDPVPSSVVPPPAPRHPMQAATWLWWMPGEHLPAVALLASLLLAFARLTGPRAWSAQGLPPGRGPPQLAFPR